VLPIFLLAWLLPFAGIAGFELLPPASTTRFRVWILAAASLGALLLHRTFRPLRSEVGGSEPGASGSRVVAIGFALILAAGAVLFAVRVRLEPLGMWDAWALHNYKARHLGLAFLEGRPVDLFPGFWEGNPALFSVQIATLAALFGGWHQAIPIGAAFFSYALTALVLFSAAKASGPGSPEEKLLFLALALAFPGVISNASDQCADAPFALAVLIAAWGLLRVSEEFPERVRSRGSWILGFAVGTAAAIKNEGALLAFLFLPCASIRLLRRGDRSRGAIVLASALPGLAYFLCVKWSLGRIYFSPPDLPVLVGNALDPARYADLAGRFARQYLVQTGGAALIAAIVAWRRHRFAALVCLLGFLSYHLVFIAVPREFAWQAEVAYARVTLHFLPALCFLALAPARGSQRTGPLAGGSARGSRAGLGAQGPPQAPLGGAHPPGLPGALVVVPQQVEHAVDQKPRHLVVEPAPRRARLAGGDLHADHHVAQQRAAMPRPPPLPEREGEHVGRPRPAAPGAVERGHLRVVREPDRELGPGLAELAQEERRPCAQEAAVHPREPAAPRRPREPRAHPFRRPPPRVS
jgi:hypothetical protein